VDWQIRCAASSANPCFPHYGGDGMLCPRTEDSRTYFGVSLSASCRKELPHSVPRSFSVRDRILDWRDGGVPRGGEGKGCRAGTTVSKVAAIARRGAGGGQSCSTRGVADRRRRLGSGQFGVSPVAFCRRELPHDP